MKILFDPQIFQLGYSGMRRYYSVLYSGLIDAGIDIVHPEKSPFAQNPSERSLLSEVLHPKINRVFNKFKFYRIRENFFNALRNDDYDLVYLTSPAFETELLKHIQDKPFVMTVHDTMQIARGLHTFVDEPRDTMALGYLAHRAERIACVSNYTKQDLCNKYLIDPAKTQTVYLANFLDSDPEKMTDLPDQFILNVGIRNGRKNFFEWIKAVSPYLRNQPNLKVLVTGELNTYENHYYKKLGVLENVVSRKEVTDAQLVNLYRKATGLVYPSLYEGFGLPVVEAMANGCPVITSNCTSIPEVAGSATLLMNPTNPESMLNSFIRFMEDPELRKELSEKGLEQSKTFSKDKFISEMIDLFEQAIESHN